MECPKITSIDASIPSCQQVMSEGGWNVTITPHITPSGSVTTYIWTFGDGESYSQSPLDGIVPPIQHKYKCAGHYYITLTILSNCQPNYVQTFITELEIPVCGCPTISDITASADPSNPCKITFIAKVGDPFYQCIEKYVWHFGDGHEEQSDVATIEHTYDPCDLHPRNKAHVVLTLEGGIGNPDGETCHYDKDVDIPGCNCDEGGGGGGRRPCPWWNPRCWSNICNFLPFLALAFAVAGTALIIAGLCVNNPYLVIAGAALMVLAFGIFYLWYTICKRLHKDFCQTINELITILYVIVVGIQPPLVAIIVAIEAIVAATSGGEFFWPCAAGAVITWIYYALLMTYLVKLRNWAGCPHDSALDH
jgi:hypothetical protein